jgi:hypothetical protein
VHGIEVSGPTFPASIWRLFMEPAVKYAPFPTEFPVATHEPVWTSHTLQYAMSGGYSSSSSSSSSGTYTPPAPQTTPQNDGNQGNQGFVQVPNDGH